MSDTAEQAMPTKSNAAESSGFLDGQEYTAAFLYEFVALLVGNGVYNGDNRHKRRYERHARRRSCVA